MHPSLAPSSTGNNVTAQTHPVVYLVSPPEEARRVDVGVGVIFIVRHLNVVPHAVVYSRHDASEDRAALASEMARLAGKLLGRTKKTRTSDRKTRIKQKLSTSHACVLVFSAAAGCVKPT